MAEPASTEKLVITVSHDEDSVVDEMEQSVSDADFAPTEEELKVMQEEADRLRKKFICLADIKRFTEHIREIEQWLKENGKSVPTDEEIEALQHQAHQLTRKFSQLHEIKKHTNFLSNIEEYDELGDVEDVEEVNEIDEVDETDVENTKGRFASRKTLDKESEVL